MCTKYNKTFHIKYQYFPPHFFCITHPPVSHLPASLLTGQSVSQRRRSTLRLRKFDPVGYGSATTSSISSQPSSIPASPSSDSVISSSVLLQSSLWAMVFVIVSMFSVVIASASSVIASSATSSASTIRW